MAEEGLGIAPPRSLRRPDLVLPWRSFLSAGVRLSLALTVGAVLPGAAAGQEAPIGLPRGARPAPVVLESVTGETVNLGDLIGSRPVYVQFWATWCPLCKELEPRVLEAYRRFGSRVAFFGVAVAVNQSPGRVRRYLEDHPLPFPMLWDGQGEAVRAFAAPTTSYVVVLDAEGKVAYTGTGGDQDLDAALAAVAPPGD